jgi:uncharacterized protein (TIGR03083 family)
MLQQAIDFREESEALFSLLDAASDQAWEQPTQFKGWTFNDIIAHLHFGDYAAARQPISTGLRLTSLYSHDYKIRREQHHAAIHPWRRQTVL